jgi:hypothetical protein
MTPVDQLVLHDPTVPEQLGDCLRACIASLLDLPADQVPHFVQDGYYAGDLDDDGDQWYRLLRGWLRDRGMDVLWPAADDVGEYLPWSLLDLCLLCGPSPRGPFLHVVVGRPDGTVVHDPHPSRDGLAGAATSIALLVPAEVVAADG